MHRRQVVEYHGALDVTLGVVLVPGQEEADPPQVVATVEILWQREIPAVFIDVPAVLPASAALAGRQKATTGASSFSMRCVNKGMRREGN